MPSTFTENTGIELIADGEQTGAWGQTTNNNFDIVDRALNGSVSIALSGTTHTLTTSDGILSDGQYAVLVFTGSLAAANTVTIAPNTAQKTYIVRNTTNQSVILSQGSGANVTVPAGLTKLVYTDGGGATAAVFDITNTLSGTFTGNLTGNASTATALQTARTIGGVSFDGTANIDLPGVNTAGNQDTTGDAAGLTGLTASVAELNVLDGLTATTEELNFVDGVTSDIQTQIDGKQADSTLLSSIAALPNLGIVVNKGDGTATVRSIMGGTGISVSNGGGANAAPTISADLASQAEAEAGIDDTKVMTPLRVAQAVVASSALIVEERVYDFAVSGAVSVIEFTDLSGFDYFDLESTLTLVSDTNGKIQFSPDNGATYRTSGYIGGVVDGVSISQITSSVQMTRTLANDALGSCRIIGMNEPNVKTTVSGVFGGGSERVTSTGGRYNNLEAHNALRVLFGANVSQGVLKLRGYKFT